MGRMMLKELGVGKCHLCHEQNHNFSRRPRHLLQWRRQRYLNQLGQLRCRISSRRATASETSLIRKDYGRYEKAGSEYQPINAIGLDEIIATEYVILVNAPTTTRPVLNHLLRIASSVFAMSNYSKRNPSTQQDNLSRNVPSWVVDIDC
jgi:hypothetical protein